MSAANCIVCGSVDAPLLYRTRDRHYGIQGEFNLVRCVGCGLIHVDPMPTEIELTGYYAESYYAYQPLTTPPLWKRIARRILRLQIRTHNPRFPMPGQFLDIGCGSGSYLLEMREKGWRVRGVEPSHYGAQEGQRAGLEIFHGTLTEAGFTASSFDYIRSNHSFEHIPNPVEVAREMYRILRPGGKLFIGIPNVDSLPFRIFGRYWWYLGAPIHTYNYSTKTIITLLENIGFEVARVYYNSNFGSLLGSFQIYVNRKTNKRSDEGVLIRNRPLRIIANLLAKCLDRLRLGDAIEVICEKPITQNSC